MVSPTFVYQRGEPISFDVVDQDAAYVGCTLSLKLKAAISNNPPPATAPTIAEFAVTYFQATDTDPPRWLCVIADTAALKPGSYVTNGVIQQGAATVEVTEPILIRLTESTA